MKMKPTMRLQLCLLLFALVNLAAAEPDYCSNRNDEVVDEKKCIYGWDVDPCGIKVCAKGRYNFFTDPIFTQLQTLISHAEIDIFALNIFFYTNVKLNLLLNITHSIFLIRI